MKKEINKETYNFLFLLFILYISQHLIDDLQGSNRIVRTFKQAVNKFSKFLRLEVFKILNSMYDTDADEFEIMEDAIYKNAKEFASKGFLEFFTVVD